ncbi:MAG: PKD domain-containing protein [Nitrososphaeraceae archaeon]
MNVHILHSLSLLTEIHEASTTRLAPLADGNCVPDPTCSPGSHLDETFTCIPDNCQPGFKYENGQCVPANNQSPIANAGPDQTVESEDSVTLDGTGSSDPDGDALTYQWSQIAGPQVTLSGNTSPSPVFTAPSVNENTTLTFQLD